MVIKDAVWFTSPNGCVGIVIIEDSITKEHKAYIGVGKGMNERIDAMGIALHGTPVYKKQMATIIGWLDLKGKPSED